MSDTDGFSRLVDPDLDEVHAVKGAANGTPFLVAKQAAEGVQGLLAPELVRELVAKAEPNAPEPVTFTGSPAAVADLMHRMHAAPALDLVVKSSGEYAEVVKAKYSTEDKRKLADKGHAMRNADGEPDYPIDDEEDLGKAIHAVGRGGADHDKIRKYVMRRAREMGKSDQIPDNWASDGSLKQPVTKADGTTDPGSPAWESADAANGEKVTAQILACIPAVRALVMREATEVGAGHTDDICDVMELQCAIDSLTEAAKTVAGFAVSEHAEAGETSVAKAQDAPNTPAAPAATSPKENTVEQQQTTTEVTKAEDAAAATGQPEPQQVTKAQALAALGLSPEQLAEIGAASVLKALGAPDPQTPGAEAAPTDARTIPGTDTVQAPVQAPDEVMKAMASSFATALSEAMAPVVKQVEGLTTQVNAQGERVEKMAAQPDNRRSPLLNGATGEAGPALREAMAKSPEWQTIAKAVEALPEGPERDEAKRKLALAALEARFS